MGIQTSSIEKWLQLPGHSVEEILNTYAEDKQIFHKITTVPLPHSIDTRVRLPQVHYMQSNSEEDSILTYQVTHKFSCGIFLNYFVVVFLQFFVTPWIRLPKIVGVFFS
jgi:hypothetical protein